jgi:hypothetical protein
MAFYHVGSCACPMGCCDCGTVAPKKPEDMTKQELLKRVIELEKKEAQRVAEAEVLRVKEREFMNTLVNLSVKDANESAKEVWRANERRIKEKLKLIKEIEKQALKVLDRESAERVLYLYQEFEHYKDFKQYQVRR